MASRIVPKQGTVDRLPQTSQAQQGIYCTGVAAGTTGYDRKCLCQFAQSISLGCVCGYWRPCCFLSAFLNRQAPMRRKGKCLCRQIPPLQSISQGCWFSAL